MKPLTSLASSSLMSDRPSMANRTYLPTHHRLLPGFPQLPTSRSAVVGATGRVSPPDFAYDTYPREAARGGGSVRDMPNFGRAPTSPGNSSLSMAYPTVQEFPYGLSGVQMPTYNFGSELYNYVSNGFPRKSRMCSYCNKVFTRSTTRRYHEKRCPLLRASNSLAKNEENSSATSAIVGAMKDQHHQQHQKESPSGVPAKSGPLLPRTLSSSITNTTSAQAGSIPHSSPPLPSLHPAYPTSFPTSSTLASNASRASIYSGYPHSYRSHFYNSISAAALASLDQNSSKLESDNTSWGSSSPPPPTGKSRERERDQDHDRARHPSEGSSTTSTLGNNRLGSGAPPLPKSFTSEAAVDLTARYCADFSIRSQPPVFPATSLRAHPPSPPSPDVEENKATAGPGENNADMSNCESPDVVIMSGRPRWPNQIQEKMTHFDRSPSSEVRLKCSSPSSGMWDSKTGVDPVQGPYMQVAPLDEEDEDDLDEDEDEEEVEEDEEQFKSSSPLNPGEEMEGSSLRHRSTAYNPLICQFCKKIFSDVSSRKAHEALHTLKKSYACSLCSHSFHCAYSLRIHILRHHKHPPYKCKYCLNSCESPSTLKSHLLKQHSLPQSEQQSLKYFNLLTGSGSPPLDSMLKTAVSDGEQERYNTGVLPYQHRRSADNLPETLAFSEDTMKTHASNEFNEALAMNGKIGGSQEVETETCKICNKAFAKSFIRFHERAHADQKPYECPICNKRFGYKNNMKSHMKLHQGLKPYQCQICGARFTRGSTLRRHGRRHNISRNSMLDFVLYDHSAGPSRAMGVGQKLNMTSSNPTLPEGGPPYSHPSQATPSDAHGKALGVGSNLNHPASITNGFDGPRFNTNVKRSPSRLSPPQHGSTTRATNNHLTSQTMTNSMVGGLAAVAAANLFAYPGAAAAPHLYQFYASTNPLMGYPSYPPPTANTNQTAPVVQSDALNLSLSKRKSPFVEEEEEGRKKSTNAVARHESVIVSGDNGAARSHLQRMVDEKFTKVKIEAEETGEVAKREIKNPFTPYNNNGKDFQSKKLAYFDTKEQLKISTEDFGAQVNICCPSPQTQSSANYLTHGSNGSPVGSSSGPDSHRQSQTSPSDMSQTCSPVDSLPSPNSLTPSHLQNLLVSLITSGRLFRCSFCDIYFTEYAMFRLHQKYHQCDSARPFLCAVCGEDCKDKTYFTVHLSEHLGLGPKTALT